MKSLLAQKFRMPISFGPAPGPRNLPSDREHLRYERKVTEVSISARTDGAMLSPLLPDGFALRGDARLEISMLVLTNVGWLAGRGYNILIVRIPAAWNGVEKVEGRFVPVMWESMADPIITGRDELGWCKINAEIPDPEQIDGRWSCFAAWEGYRFFEMTTGCFTPTTEVEMPSPLMFQRYVPCVGSSGGAEISYPTATRPDGRSPTLHSAEQAVGRFSFRHARWEDMPTQYPIVNALAALPLDDFSPATRIDMTGGGDGSSQEVLR